METPLPQRTTRAPADLVDSSSGPGLEAANDFGKTTRSGLLEIEDAVDVVWHDDVGIDPEVRERLWQRQPLLFDDAARAGQSHLSLLDPPEVR